MNRTIIQLLVLLLALSSAPGVTHGNESSSPPKKVLLLSYFGQENLEATIAIQTFRSGLSAAWPKGFEFYTETLETYRFPGDDHTQIMRDYLRRKYAGVKFDVIAVLPDTGLEFLIAHRDELFPGTPIVYLRSKQPDPSVQLPGITGLWSGPKLRGTLDLALKVHPSTRQVFVVSGKLNNNGVLEAAARQQFEDFENRVAINYLTDLSIEELGARIGKLPDHSIVILLRQAIGYGNRSIPVSDGATLVAQLSNAPVYSGYDSWIGTGIVGGDMISTVYDLAELAKLAVRVADGTRPEDIEPVNIPSKKIFDWRQLRRWGISEKLLPPGSDIRYKELGVWEKYRLYIIGAISLCLIQTAFIGLLLVERLKRRRAEDARRHLADIVESSNDAIIGLSLDGTITSWNQGAETIYGYTAEEIVGLPISIIVPVERMSELSDNLKWCSMGVNLKHFETVWLKRSGEPIDVSVSLSEIRDSNGKVISAAAISQDITERKGAEEKLQQLTTRLINLQDEERKRMARELHDVTAQNLFAINLNLMRLQREELKPVESEEILIESRKLGHQSLEEIRTLSYLLHPPVLDQAGLVDALKWYVNGFFKRSGIYVEVIALQEIGRLPSLVETAIFRIVQESLTNVWRHSGSSTATIRLEKKIDRIVLQIQDQGQGMSFMPRLSEDQKLATAGVGVTGMHERMRQLGGTLEIRSTNKGVVVIATAPLTNGVNGDSYLAGG